MDALTEAVNLRAQGRFTDALRQLDTVNGSQSQRQAADVVKIDLLEHTGRHGQARSLARSLLRSKTLSHADRGICEFVLARVDREDGDFQSSVARLQKAVMLAAQGDDLEHGCWLQLRLLRSVAELSGPEAAAVLLADLRSKVRRTGNIQLSAALHIFVGEMEAKRGLTSSGKRHTHFGLQLLSNASNLWLEADAEITNVAIAIMQCDFDSALAHAVRAHQVANQSGRAAARRAALANLGNVRYAEGHFDEAIDYYHRAIEALPSAGDNIHAVLDSIARVELARGRLDQSAQLLDRILESVRTPSSRRPYAYRHAKLTRTQLLIRQGSTGEALASAESLAQIAGEAGDRLLHQVALLTKAELLQQIGRGGESMAMLDLVTDALAQHPPDLYAHYERILAVALATDGDFGTAERHFDRAKRLYEGIRSAPGLLELSRRWKDVSGHDRTTSRAADASAHNPAAAARNVLQSVAALLCHHSRLELVARELVHLLRETDCAVGAQAVSMGDGDAPEVLAAASSPAATDGARLRLFVGFARERRIELIVEPRLDIESRATMNAVRLLLTMVQDLERARAEREERLSLWPPDDEPAEFGGAVANGRMRELMSSAQRIAGTNVSVFITGESGTGKEILARAIHSSSDRSDKPFIAFNCTAVPREMLESQLFGHRRGAFTGADRDHAGMIGAARGGTLFLDEIGELGLDLQPKLLRFLESGEICPLGESTPFIVNVRIVAATNSKVEQLVEDGRFREDLFYRLNVFRLRIDPLRERRDEIPALVRHFVAHAATEFQKGSVRIAEETMEHLLLGRWPGNVRQLQNEIRRMVALAEPNSVLAPSALSPEVFNARLTPRPHPSELELTVPLRSKLPPTLAKIEREMIRLALRDHHGKVDETARALGLSRKGLYLKRQRLGL